MRAVEEGDRVAQLILEKIHTAEVLEVQVRIFQFTA
jgi:dUTPase